MPIERLADPAGNRRRRPARSVSAAAALLLLATLHAPAALAQMPTPPPPEATDPTRNLLMQGFPPPPDRRVTLANLLHPIRTRWGYQHLRELGPTATVWRGPERPSPLPEGPAAPLESLTFDDGGGNRTSIATWQQSTYTDALVVLHRGRIVYERYYAGMQPQTRHFLASMSKSFTGLLAAQLVAEGRLNPAAKVAEYLPELAASGWGDATIQQTLDMTTAIRYGEDFTNPKSEVFAYLIAGGLIPAPAGYPGPRSIHELLAALPKAGEHGARFAYKSVDTEVIGWVLQRLTGKPFATLVSERLWGPLGAQEDADVWVGPDGAQLTSIGLNATARDLARLGEMLRQGGHFASRAVMPAAAVEQLRRGGDREKFLAAGQAARAGYSYHDFWWIPHDADRTFEAKGLNGQHLHVNPAAELVIVKLSTHPLGNTLVTHGPDRAAFAAIAGALRPAR